MRDIPNLKRLWYCQQKYEKTTGCVCKKSGVCECQSILNVPLTEIDSLRSEKRAARQNQRRWKLVDIDYTKLESRVYQSRGIDVMKQMIVSRVMKEEMLRLAYGDRRYPIFDQVILDESVYLRPLRQPMKISRETFDTIWTSPPKEDYIEGKPKEPKPWQKLIPDNRKLKPR